MSVVARIARILVPTDFSPPAGAACELAARLATRAHSDLVLFHAFSGLELLQEVGRERGKPQVDVLDDVRDRLRTWFETVVPAQLRPSLTVRFHVKVSDPTPGIGWAAAESQADLILMATHGRRGLAHLLLGSVAQAVLRTVSVPVLTLRLGQGARPLTGVKRILWATDLSAVSEGAWQYALTLAGVFEADMVLLHAVSPPEIAEALAEHPGPLPEAEVQRSFPTVEQELGRRQREAEATGLRAHWKVVVGAPTEVIVAQAETEQAGLIVMGTRGRTGLPHVILGSVAAAVIRKAPCPVLAVQTTPRGHDTEGFSAR